jgi:hypothetical protein
MAEHKISILRLNDDDTETVACSCGANFTARVGSQALSAWAAHRANAMRIPRAPIDAVDPIMLAATIASEQHDRGEISDEKLIEVLELCINTTAEANGYAELYGVPFPERKR